MTHEIFGGPPTEFKNASDRSMAAVYAAPKNRVLSLLKLHKLPARPPVLRATDCAPLTMTNLSAGLVNGQPNVTYAIYGRDKQREFFKALASYLLRSGEHVIQDDQIVGVTFNGPRSCFTLGECVMRSAYTVSTDREQQDGVVSDPFPFRRCFFDLDGVLLLDGMTRDIAGMSTQDTELPVELDAIVHAQMMEHINNLVSQITANWIVPTADSQERDPLCVVYVVRRKPILQPADEDGMKIKIGYHVVFTDLFMDRVKQAPWLWMEAYMYFTPLHPSDRPFLSDQYQRPIFMDTEFDILLETPIRSFVDYQPMRSQMLRMMASRACLPKHLDTAVTHKLREQQLRASGMVTNQQAIPCSCAARAVPCFHVRVTRIDQEEDRGQEQEEAGGNTAVYTFKDMYFLFTEIRVRRSEDGYDEQGLVVEMVQEQDYAFLADTHLAELLSRISICESSPRPTIDSESPEWQESVVSRLVRDFKKFFTFFNAVTEEQCTPAFVAKFCQLTSIQEANFVLGAGTVSEASFESVFGGIDVDAHRAERKETSDSIKGVFEKLAQMAFEPVEDETPQHMKEADRAKRTLELLDALASLILARACNAMYLSDNVFTRANVTFLDIKFNSSLTCISNAVIAFSGYACPNKQLKSHGNSSAIATFKFDNRSGSAPTGITSSSTSSGTITVRCSCKRQSDADDAKRVYGACVSSDAGIKISDPQVFERLFAPSKALKELIAPLAKMIAASQKKTSRKRLRPV